MEDRELRAQAERARALAWVNEKWTASKICPICATNTWSITEVLEIKQYEGGNIVLGGGTATYPVFHVMCANCGYTHTFNAVISGVVKQSSPEDSQAHG